MSVQLYDYTYRSNKDVHLHIHILHLHHLPSLAHSLYTQMTKYKLIVSIKSLYVQNFMCNFDSKAIQAESLTFASLSTSPSRPSLKTFVIRSCSSSGCWQEHWKCQWMQSTTQWKQTSLQSCTIMVRLTCTLPQNNSATTCIRVHQDIWCGDWT